jgi:serine/threonine protein kinase
MNPIFEDVKITGLSNSTYIKKDQKLKSIVGTAGYTAPEILNNRGYDCSSDVFSCGCIFYHLLTGLNLFNASTKEKAYQANAKCKLDDIEK